MTAAPTNAMSIVPTPPSPLKCNLLPLSAGAIVHRIHDKGLRAEQFNPGIKGNSRFAPIKTINGSAIPTAYAATTFACAVFETIFHDIDPDAPFKSVPWTTIEKLSYSTIEFGRDVQLCKMFSADLMRWNCARTQLIDTPPSAYPQTRCWSAAIHESEGAVDGMVWTSRKFDEEKAMMLFGTRLTPSDLIVKSSVTIASDANALSELHLLAKRSGILISR